MEVWRDRTAGLKWAVPIWGCAATAPHASRFGIFVRFARTRPKNKQPNSFFQPSIENWIAQKFFLAPCRKLDRPEISARPSAQGSVGYRRWVGVISAGGFYLRGITCFSRKFCRIPALMQQRSAGNLDFELELGVRQCLGIHLGAHAEELDNMCVQIARGLPQP